MWVPSIYFKYYVIVWLQKSTNFTLFLCKLKFKRNYKKIYQNQTINLSLILYFHKNIFKSLNFYSLSSLHLQFVLEAYTEGKKPQTRLSNLNIPKLSFCKLVVSNNLKTIKVNLTTKISKYFKLRIFIRHKKRVMFKKVLIVSLKNYAKIKPWGKCCSLKFLPGLYTLNRNLATVSS